MKIFCKLGFHKWKEDGLATYFEYFWKCKRCGKREIRNHLTGGKRPTN